MWVVRDGFRVYECYCIFYGEWVAVDKLFELMHALHYSGVFLLNVLLRRSEIGD